VNAQEGEIRLDKTLLEDFAQLPDRVRVERVWDKDGNNNAVLVGEFRRNQLWEGSFLVSLRNQESQVFLVE
jgi:hypothetical protein